MGGFDLFQLNWSALVLPESCLGSFRARLLLVALAPMAVIAIVFLCLTLNAYRHHSRKAALVRVSGRIQNLAQSVANGLLSTTPLALFVVFIFLPSVSATLFQAWSCEVFSFTSTEDHYYLRKDLSTRAPN